MRFTWFAMAFLALFCVSPRVALAQGAVSAVHVPEGRVRVDGMLRDWGGVPFQSLGEGSDASLRYAFGFDAKGLYVATAVKDDRIVRSSRLSTRQDAVVLTLVFSSGGEPGPDGTHELWLFPGVSGRSPSTVAVSHASGAMRGMSAAKIVEYVTSGGYELEVFLPWSSLSLGGLPEDARVALRLVDVDSESRPVVEVDRATARADSGSVLPRLVLATDQRQSVDAFLTQRGLADERPRLDRSVDVRGDARPERVRAVGKFVLVTGPDTMQGRGFAFLELPVSTAADVIDVRLVDLTADRRPEIVCELQQSNDRGSRRLFLVFRFDGERIRAALTIEIGKRTPEGEVRSSVQVLAVPKKPPVVEVKLHESFGRSWSNLAETPATDAVPILLPWGEFRSRRFQWNGRAFAKVAEERRPQPRRAAAPTGQATQATASSPPSAAEPASTRTDLVRTALERLGIPSNTRPRHHAFVHVAEDRRPEHVYVYERALIVAGPGFRGGSDFFYAALPVQRGDDVLTFRTADLTGDGAAEVLARVRQTTSDVQREWLVAYTFANGSFRRILTADVMRGQSGKHVRNRVRLLPAGTRTVVRIEAGDAVGFTRENWPFADGAEPSMLPLLLPWRDSAVVYEWKAGAFARRDAR